MNTFTHWLRALSTLIRHRRTDDAVARRSLPPEAIERLRQYVAASEQRHSGQIRVCIEASLPTGYLGRHLRQRVPLRRVVRERAVMLFGKLRVWDTERNNGVLIYLLVAERAIELVADRGVDRCVAAGEWQAMVRRMGEAFAQGRFEDGLTQALEEVSAVLVAHFPREPGAPGASGPHNELPDLPVLL